MTDTNNTHDTDVLIVGGSLVGLSAATFLAWRGVRATIIEKHAGSSPHPRAVGFTQHTLEFYRAVGIADRIPVADPGFRLRRATVDSLAAGPRGETSWTPQAAQKPQGGQGGGAGHGGPGAPSREVSPAGMAGIAQDRLEPILRDRARELSADLRLGTEMLSFAQSGEGVTVRVRERDSGRTYDLSAAYLIAADGADSTIREALGIARAGVGHLMVIQSVLFRCPEADAYLASGFQQFEIDQPDLKAFLTTYGDGRWVLMFYDDVERSAEVLDAAIRAALGRDMPFEVLAKGRWDMAGLIAERYDAGPGGRVFLVGDAAHQLPPTRGGFGANTGIDDAWNLAWKLEMVLRGLSSPELLDTYSAERRPVGWLRHQQTFARPDYAKYVGNALEGETLYDDQAMELGQLLRSDVILDAGDDLPPARHPDDWHGQPGVRAPHLWIERDGARLSTIDLVTQGFTLLTENPAWRGVAEAARAATGLPLDTVVLGEDARVVDEASFSRLYGTGAAGAALVRPDGVVAWRTDMGPEKEPRDLAAVLRRAAHASEGGER